MRHLACFFTRIPICLRHVAPCHLGCFLYYTSFKSVDSWKYCLNQRAASFPQSSPALATVSMVIRRTVLAKQSPAVPGAWASRAFSRDKMHVVKSVGHTYSKCVCVNDLDSLR